MKQLIALCSLFAIGCTPAGGGGSSTGQKHGESVRGEDGPPHRTHADDARRPTAHNGSTSTSRPSQIDAADEPIVCREWVAKYRDSPEGPYATQVRENGIWKLRYSDSENGTRSNGGIYESDLPIALSPGTSPYARYIKMYDEDQNWTTLRCVDPE